MVNECLGTDAVTCQDCALRSREVSGTDAFILPPVSEETGACQFYVMAEDQSDKRMDVVGSNGNEGDHYESGYINIKFLFSGIAVILFVGFLWVNFAAVMVK